ncbi:hypothetical protein JQ594_15580 [Bradyrhizobium manausense]|uniref:hypothetical protein n=1 Tax=Bradyrhizobium manausense TaxID=989370 RepID=UPI001BA8D217|nr:hypothetical protein [Bradyrhizobium manausense]MBR0687352.1 hypothetical protein [Bradyrhizobium manausense]
MADIKQRISLDGAEDVAAKLKRIGDTGQDAFRKLKEYSGPAGEGISNLSRSLEGEGSAHEIGEKLRETLHTLHPIIGQAGLELGELGAFARLAGAGLVPLGAALTGTVLIALAKLGDETQKSKARLKALGDESGFEKLSERAKHLGVSVDTLQPRYEKFLAAQQRATAASGTVTYAPGYQPGGPEETASNVRVVSGGRNLTPPPREAFGQFDKALFEEIRLDVKDAEEAARLAEEFESGLSKNGLTGEALRSLQESSPHAANFITGSLGNFLGQGFPNPNALAAYLDRRSGSATPPPGLTDEQKRAFYASHPSIGGVGASDVISEVAKRAPEADKEAEAARGVTEAFEGLEASTKRAAEALGGDHLGLTGAIDGISHGFDKISDMVEHRAPPSAGPQSLGEVFNSDKGDLLGRIVGYIRGGAENNQPGGGNPFGVITNFVTKALTDPGAIKGNTPEPAGKPALTTESLSQTKIPGFDRTFDGWLTAPQPAQQPQQQPQAQVPVDAAGNNTQATVLEQIGSAIVSAITALANKANPQATKIEGTDAENALGIRGATGGLATPQGFEPGGHVRGAGTATSDSIPAMLSNGEYVVKASSVQKVGLGFMNMLNAGHFAGGGQANAQVNPDGSGYIQDDGNIYVYANAQEREAIQRTLQAQHEADAWQAKDRAESKKRNRSLFSGRFGHDDNVNPIDTYVAGGGLIGHFAGGGLIGHFAGGGAAFDLGSMVDAPGGSRAVSDAALNSIAPSGGHGGERLHPVTLDMGTHAVSGLLAPTDVVDSLRRESVARQVVRTGPRPSWAGS